MGPLILGLPWSGTIAIGMVDITVLKGLSHQIRNAWKSYLSKAPG
jgi:hypothetical protein